jgi:hypothetical protein
MEERTMRKWRVVIREVGKPARVIETKTKRAAEAEATFWRGRNPEIVHPDDWRLYSGLQMERQTAAAS